MDYKIYESHFPIENSEYERWTLETAKAGKPMVRYERFVPNATASGAEYIAHGFTRKFDLGDFMVSEQPSKVKNRLLEMDEVRSLLSN